MHPVSTSSRRSRRMHVFAVPAVLAGAAVLILAGTAISQTVTPQSEDPVQHFIDCAGVLITAPDIHAAYCLPSNVPPELAAPSSASSTGHSSDCMVEDVVADGYLDDGKGDDCDPYPDNVDDTSDDFPDDQAPSHS